MFRPSALEGRCYLFIYEWYIEFKIDCFVADKLLRGGGRVCFLSEICARRIGSRSSSVEDRRIVPEIVSDGLRGGASRPVGRLHVRSRGTEG